MLLAVAAAVACTAISADVSPADAAGHFQVELRLPGQPWVGVQSPRRETYCATLPAGWRIKKVRTFYGVDRGNIVEASLHVVVNGFQLATRSEHKETDGIYDAWKSEPVDYLTLSGQSELMVYAAGWSTMQGRPANMEYGVIIEMAPR